MDLLNDWKLFALEQLADSNIRVKPNELDEVTIAYLNQLFRRVVTRKRAVHISKSFSCPKECKRGLEQLKQRFLDGEDVNCYLSRGLKREANDGLLYDWGIYHFHLGESLDSDGFIERTGPLLFALVTHSDVFFINTYSHGKWAKYEIIETIHQNWPSAIEGFKFLGAKPTTERVPEDVYDRLRKAGVTLPVQMSDGTIYGSMGGGYTSTGSSLQVVRLSHEIYRVIQKIEDYVVQNFPLLKEKAKAKGYIVHEIDELQLYVGDDSWGVISHAADVYFPLSTPVVPNLTKTSS